MDENNATGAPCTLRLLRLFVCHTERIIRQMKWILGTRLENADRDGSEGVSPKQHHQFHRIFLS